MRLLSLSLLLGTLPILFLQSLPNAYWLGGILLFSLLLGAFYKYKFKNVSIKFLMVFGFLVGLFISTVTAQLLLDKRLPSQWQGQDMIVQGSVVDIPENREDGTRLRFKISHATLLANKDEGGSNKRIKLSGVIRLGWFQQRQTIKAGESWQLRIRLKRPSGFLNPGGFDYEKWLFTERIIATGYIRKSIEQNHRLKPASWWSLNRWREKIHQNIQEKVANKPAAAVLSALVVAIRTELSDQQWQQLQKTGTNHLIAISGLHIAIVAAFGFFPVMLIWRLFPKLNERIPLQVVGSISGGIFAIIYAMLAGFTLPTQRALIMVIIALLALMGRRHYTSSQILSFALLAVLLIDPLAAMTISFWLSFVAVALILYFLNRQIKKPFLQLIKLQVWLSLAMLPLTLIFFGSASLASPIANIVAIPWVSLIVVPISLLALVFMPISSWVSGSLFNIAAITVDYLFAGLNFLSQSPLSSLNPTEVPLLYLLMAFAGLLFLILPKGFPGRWLGLVALIPALLFTAEKPNQGAFSFTMLDVGQGMASVVETANHSLIYDTGTRFSDTFDIGKLVVIPYLRSQGIDSIDRMIISHEDIDHRGGAAYITKSIDVKSVLSSEVNILANHKVEHCTKGMKWQWDGVNFEILSPDLDYQENENNRSCVLLVSNQHHSLLLTGDIQKKTEKRLVNDYKKQLSSEVISVPHHGSKTSSTAEFIEYTSPKLALITAGFRSRFGHPKAEVIARYKEQGVRLMDTVSDGAIQVNFPTDKAEISASAYREKARGFWSR